jgi:hypothetical protein
MGTVTATEPAATKLARLREATVDLYMRFYEAKRDEVGAMVDKSHAAFMARLSRPTPKASRAPRERGNVVQARVGVVTGTASHANSNGIPEVTIRETLEGWTKSGYTPNEPLSGGSVEDWEGEFPRDEKFRGLLGLLATSYSNALTEEDIRLELIGAAAALTDEPAADVQYESLKRVLEYRVWLDMEALVMTEYATYSERHGDDPLPWLNFMFGVTYMWRTLPVVVSVVADRLRAEAAANRKFEAAEKERVAEEAATRARRAEETRAARKTQAAEAARRAVAAEAAQMSVAAEAARAARAAEAAREVEEASEAERVTEEAEEAEEAAARARIAAFGYKLMAIATLGIGVVYVARPLMDDHITHWVETEQAAGRDPYVPVTDVGKFMILPIDYATSVARESMEALVAYFTKAAPDSDHWYVDLTGYTYIDKTIDWATGVTESLDTTQDMINILDRVGRLYIAGTLLGYLRQGLTSMCRVVPSIPCSL